MKNSKDKMVDLIVTKETDPAYLSEIGYCGNVFMIFWPAGAQAAG